MRFKLPKEPKDGDERVVKKFALFPMFCEGEVRWLEKVTAEQKFEYDAGDEFNRWHNKKFVDDKQK